MEPTRLIIVAVGGQGNLLASRVLGEAALLSGVPVRMSEIHGMAQRGGVVESAIVFGDARSTIISDGEADVLVGFRTLGNLAGLEQVQSPNGGHHQPGPLAAVYRRHRQGRLPGSGSSPGADPAKNRPADRLRRRLPGQGGRQCPVGEHGAPGCPDPDRHPAPEGRATSRRPSAPKPRRRLSMTNLKAFELGFSAAAAVV